MTVDLYRPLKYCIQNKVIVGNIFTAFIKEQTCISTEHLSLLSVIQNHFAKISLPDRGEDSIIVTSTFTKTVVSASLREKPCILPMVLECGNLWRLFKNIGISVVSRGGSFRLS